MARVRSVGIKNFNVAARWKQIRKKKSVPQGGAKEPLSENSLFVAAHGGFPSGALAN